MSVVEHASAVRPAYRTSRASPVSQRRVKVALIATMLLSTLAVAFLARHSEWTTPKHGIGYWLGICGASIILLTFLYPLRKRWALLNGSSTVARLFRWHMLFGVLGPTLIVMHTNFQLSAINSTVALSAMLLVVTSGLIGRFLHGRVHIGAHGRRAELRELVEDAEFMKTLLGTDVPSDSGVLSAFNEVEAALFKRPSILRALRIRTMIGTIEARLRDTLARLASGPSRRSTVLSSASLQHLDDYICALRKAAAFAFWERIFSLWHILHAPVLALLVLSAVAHIVAVHLY